MAFSLKPRQRLSSLKHIHPSYVIVAAIILVSVFVHDPSAAIREFLAPLRSVLNDVVLISVGMFFIIALLTIFTSIGKIKLGAPEDKPTYSLPAWLSMLFAAGMGIGLVFSGFAEPLLHMQHIPSEGTIAGMNTESKAMLITQYHWGFHAWAIYGLAALTIAYFSYCKNDPMLASAPVHEFAKDKMARPIEQLIDSVAIVAVLFGVAASLAQGTWLIESGLVTLEQTTKGSAQGWILLLIVICFTLSALSGLGRGIKWLSIINMWLAGALMMFVVMIAPENEHPIIRHIWEYIAYLPRLSIDPHALSRDQEWLTTWPSAYMIWWVAWTPFVGVFIARISRGYTIRTFMLGVLFVPAIFSLIWFGIFGTTGFSVIEQAAQTDVPDLAGMPQISFIILELLPYSTLTMILVMLLTAIFLITSADSGSYILGMFSTHGERTPPKRARLTWGVAIALISAWLVYQPDGMTFIRQVIVISSLPFLVILWLQVAALLTSLYRGRGR